MANLLRFPLFLILLFGLSSMFVNAQESADTPNTPYVSKTGSYTVFHPSLWIAFEDENGIVTFADSYSALSSYSRKSALNSNTLILRIFDPNRVEDTLQEAVDNYLSVIDRDDLEPEEIRIGLRPAIRIYSNTGTAYAFTTPEGNIGFAVLFHPKDDYISADTRAKRVLATVTTTSLESLLEGYEASPLPEQYDSDENPIVFNYPETWGIDDESISPTLIISSNANDIDSSGSLGDFGSEMSIIYPSNVDESLSDDATLQEIAEILIKDDLPMFLPNYIELNEFDSEVLLVFENVRTYGEVAILLMRLDDEKILKWRIATADGEFQNYFLTLKAVLKTVSLDEEKLQEQGGA